MHSNNRNKGDTIQNLAKEIRKEAAQLGIPLVFVLDLVGISKSSFCRWINEETKHQSDMSIRKLTVAFKAIEELRVVKEKFDEVV